MFTLIPDSQLCKPNVKFKSGNKILEQFFFQIQSLSLDTSYKVWSYFVRKIKIDFIFKHLFSSFFNLNQELFPLIWSTYFRSVIFSVSKNFVLKVWNHLQFSLACEIVCRDSSLKNAWKNSSNPLTYWAESMGMTSSNYVAHFVDILRQPGTKRPIKTSDWNCKKVN